MKRLLFFVALIGLTGCAQNMMTRQYGGTSTQTLAPGQKLVNVSWEGTDLWFLTRERRADEKPETLELVESSTFGVMNGKIVIKEQP